MVYAFDLRFDLVYATVRMGHALGKVKLDWSPEFAYAIGLIVTDGCLSKDGRHISFTSKDLELINNFQRALGIQMHIGRKSRGYEKEKKYYVIQIGDVKFYRFLLQIGLMPNKSKIVGPINVPSKFFFDFLRGHFDGDGTSYAYWDPRWRSSYMFYTVLYSASEKHINWLRGEIKFNSGVSGHITKSENESVYHLKYAKAESAILLKKIYYNDSVLCLSRKKIKIDKAIQNDEKNNKARVEKLVNSPA